MFKIVRRYYLSQEETRWMKVLEKPIEQSLAAFYEAGNSLDRIRYARLYREHHSTFEEYCRKRWGISRTHASRLIKAYHVVENLKTKGDIIYKYMFPKSVTIPTWKPRSKQVGVKDPNTPILPTRESQVRPLTKLPKDLQKQAWQMAVEAAGEKRVTGRDVTNAVNKVTNLEINKRIDQDEMVRGEF